MNAPVNPSKFASSEVVKWATVLLGGYPKDGVRDARVYTEHVIRILSDYPIEVVKTAATRIPDTIRWLPTPADIRRVCDDIARPIRAREAYERRTREQIDERASLQAPRNRKQSMQEFRQEMTDRGFRGYLNDPSVSRKSGTVEDIKRKYGITQEDYNKIPDLPPAGSSYWRGLRGSSDGGAA